MSIQLFSFLFLIIRISLINSIYVFIEPKEKFCLKKYRKIPQVFHVLYTLKGAKQNHNIITAFGPDDFEMFRELDSLSNKVYLFVERNGYHKFCVENLEPVRLTLDFHFGDDGSEEKISVQNAENFVDEAQKLTNKIETIKTNIVDSYKRKKENYKIAKNIRDKINICMYVKIIFLLFFAVLQVVMIRSIFNQVKIVKKVELNNDETKSLKNKANDDIL